MKNNQINLIFDTTSGDIEDSFPLNQPLHALKREIMGRLQLDPSQAEDFVVTFNGTILDETKVLGDLGLEPNSVLFITRRELVKI